jgi:hypothetical protein
LSKHNIGRFFYNEEYREVQTETRTILHLGDFKLSPQERVDLQRMLDCKNACEGIEDPSLIPAIIEAAKHAQCKCTVKERISGHLLECWMPELNEALARAEGKKDGAA